MKRLWIIAAAALAATAVPAMAQPDPIVTARQGYELRLMGGGLAAGRQGLHSFPVFVFGISRAEALRRVTALRGAPTATGNVPGCGRRPLTYARFGTLSLYFHNNRWVGWHLAGPRARPPIESEWDLGIGTLRGEIDNSDAGDPVFRRTIRGVEFDADGMHGLLAGRGARARIASLWAGETCATR
jgi:hypothetical protein